MNTKGIALPLIKEVAEKAKLKKKEERTFEGQGVIEEKHQEITDISQMPEIIKIPGMDTLESANNIKELAEKKRTSIVGGGHSVEEYIHSGTSQNNNSDTNDANGNERYDGNIEDK